MWRRILWLALCFGTLKASAQEARYYKPVEIAGVDGSGVIRFLSLDNTGALLGLGSGIGQLAPGHLDQVQIFGLGPSGIIPISVDTTGALKTVGGTTASSILLLTEVPTGSINGSNALFTASYPPVAGSITVFKNGLAQLPSSYTLSNRTVTFTIPPSSTDQIMINYQHN